MKFANSKKATTKRARSASGNRSQPPTSPSRQPKAARSDDYDVAKDADTPIGVALCRLLGPSPAVRRLGCEDLMLLAGREPDTLLAHPSVVPAVSRLLQDIRKSAEQAQQLKEQHGAAVPVTQATCGDLNIGGGAVVLNGVTFACASLKRSQLLAERNAVFVASGGREAVTLLSRLCARAQNEKCATLILAGCVEGLVAAMACSSSNTVLLDALQALIALSEDPGRLGLLWPVLEPHIEVVEGLQTHRSEDVYRLAVCFLEGLEGFSLDPE
eukprot:TRINITY_DN21994_c0_g1_i1.p1 TRINITY_DN21994_c0_g1~~TRINITY_DN21994_c0_g1_i1.p1  ORF type:complete len:308 (+),score=46.24 TRINITY_DN21994_c0_g1_i1:112-924(+)